MKTFKFFTKSNINESYPEGILNGYYNHNMPYDQLRPYYKSCCGVDVYSEVEATTYNDLMLLDSWVNVWILGVIIDGEVYRSQHIGDDWEFPNNWEEDKKYIYEYMIITYPMLDQTDISEDSMDEVMVDNHYDGEVELPQREEDDEPVPTREGGIFLRTSDRLVMLEDIIRYDEVN
jgi:hypothetical protein